MHFNLMKCLSYDVFYLMKCFILIYLRLYLFNLKLYLFIYSIKALFIYSIKALFLHPSQSFPITFIH